MANRDFNKIKRIMKDFSLGVGSGGSSDSGSVKTFVPHTQGLKVKNWDSVRDTYLEILNTNSYRQYTKDNTLYDIGVNIEIPLSIKFTKNSSASVSNVLQIKGGNGGCNTPGFTATSVTLNSLSSVQQIVISTEDTIEDAFKKLPLDLVTSTSASTNIEVVAPYLEAEVYDKA